MQPRTLQIVFVLLALASAVSAQDAHIGKSCDLNAAGGSDEASFLQFDGELRNALAKRNMSAVALLVAFPLRVNDGDRGTYSLNDPTALQFRFSDVFTSETISAVTKQRPEEFLCSYRGIMYGSGSVWVEVIGGRYAVTTINLMRGGKLRSGSKIVFACAAEKHRVLVDEDVKGSPRYRAWTKPRSILEPPNLEIPIGKASIEGTGSCAYQLWTFKNGAAQITVGRLGCLADSSPPPEGATGTLSIEAEGKNQFWFCF